MQKDLVNPTLFRLIIRRSLTIILACMALIVGAHTAVAGGGASEPDVSDQLKSAERLIYKEKYARAIEVLNEITEAEPDNADAWNLLGFASRKTDALEDATLAYQNALNANPDHLSALEYQGELFIRLGEREAAEANLAKIVELCPEGCEARDLLTEALAQQ